MKYIYNLLFLGLIILLSGCSKGEKKHGDLKNTYPQKSEITIGMSFDSFLIERWQRDRDVFVSAANELGADVNVQNANGEVEEQIRQIEYFIEKKVDAIVIVCIDASRLSEVVFKAKQAGIKVIAYDRLIKDANVDLYISFDSETVGKMMAQALCEVPLKNNKVLMLSGPTADNNVSMIETGFLSVAEENQLEVIDKVYADGWIPELAAQYLNENYEILNNIGAITCGNDGIASKVVEILAEQRLAGKVPVVGQDADLEACQRIVEGTQLMTIYKPVEKLASAAAEYTILLVQGKQLPETILINDGSFQIPYVALKTYSVNKDNMKEIIIDSGFHMKEDVYLNAPDQMP